MAGKQNLLQSLFGLGTAQPEHAARTANTHVVPDATRCVQCGVCGYNCPVGIPVRDFARQGLIVDDPRCVQCGKCIEVCPRGTLRWGTPGGPAADFDDEADYAELMRLFANSDTVDP